MTASGAQLGTRAGDGPPPIVSRLVVRSAAGAHDLVVRARPEATVAEVADGVRRQLRLAPATTGPSVKGQPLPLAARWGDICPPDGSTLDLDPAPVPLPARSSGFELAVVGGPLAGRRTPLPLGRSIVGRGSGASIRLPDPELSRAHVTVLVDEMGVTVEDAGSSNGTFVDGVRLEGTRFAEDTTVVAVGRSLLSFRRTTRALPPGRRATGTARRVAPRPPRPAVEAATPVQLVRPAPPPPPRRYRIPWPAMVLPVVAGGAIAVMTGRPRTSPSPCSPPC